MKPELWLLTAAIAIVMGGAAIVLLVANLVRARRSGKQESLAQTVNRLLDEKIQLSNIAKLDDVASVAKLVRDARSEITALSQRVEDISDQPPSFCMHDPVALEHQVLDLSWQLFRNNAELSAAVDAALREIAWSETLVELANFIPPDLKPTFDAAIAPCREQRSLLTRIALIPKITQGKIKSLESVPEEIRRTRELATMLTSEISKVVDFRLRNWVTDSFLPFADLYLQRYQQAQLEQNDGALRKGWTLVRRVLQAAAVEAIDVTPGETLFDSTRHVGRSTSNDPRFSDGVITGVVRNGFIEGGQQVIRQPEVIVNRMR